MSTVVLKKKREDALIRRHPWVFSGAIVRVMGNPEPGETVDVVAANGKYLGKGAYSPQSQIRVRLWCFDERTEVDEGFFEQRLERALAARRAMASRFEGACRLVYAESDGLPGLIVDRYGDFLVCQFLTAGTEYWKDRIVAILARLTVCRGIFERSDVSVRQKEGLAPRKGVLQGEAPPDLVDIEEDGRRYQVDLVEGHKTGFYLDQRENRTFVASMAEGRRVLNAFCYTGGFGVAAMMGGAVAVTNLDSSGPALALCRANFERNGLNMDAVEMDEGSAFNRMRAYLDADRKFDMVILDPPKFSESKSQTQRSARAYKDINLQAFKLLTPGGLLVTFSCSGSVTPDLFQKIVADAALDAGKDGRILHRLSQASDHPTALPFPEGTYLKGLLVRVD